MIKPRRSARLAPKPSPAPTATSAADVQARSSSTSRRNEAWENPPPALTAEELAAKRAVLTSQQLVALDSLARRNRDAGIGTMSRYLYPNFSGPTEASKQLVADCKTSMPNFRPTRVRSGVRPV